MPNTCWNRLYRKNMTLSTRAKISAEVAPRQERQMIRIIKIVINHHVVVQYWYNIDTLNKKFHHIINFEVDSFYNNTNCLAWHYNIKHNLNSSVPYYRIRNVHNFFYNSKIKTIINQQWKFSDCHPHGLFFLT